MATQLLVDWWNERAPEIEERIRTSNDPKDDAFYWGQLVWQELDMYERLGQRVTEEDLNFIILRRGFTEEQQRYLREGLIHLGLYGPHISRMQMLMGQQDTPR